MKKADIKRRLIALETVINAGTAGHIHTPEPHISRDDVPSTVDVEEYMAVTERNVALANEATRDRMPVWESALQNLVVSTAPIRVRLRALNVMAQTVSDTLRPFSYCVNGRSHCCHGLVVVTKPEAEMIGQLIGVKPKIPKLGGDKWNERPHLSGRDR